MPEGPNVDCTYNASMSGPKSKLSSVATKAGVAVSQVLQSKLEGPMREASQLKSQMLIAHVTQALLLLS